MVQPWEHATARLTDEFFFFFNRTNRNQIFSVPISEKNRPVPIFGNRISVKIEEPN